MAGEASIGGAASGDRVIMEKSENLILTVTVRAASSELRRAVAEASTIRSRWPRSTSAVPEVGGEGLLVPDRLRLLLGDDRPWVVAAGQLGQVRALGPPPGSAGASRPGARRMSPTVRMPSDSSSPPGDRTHPPQGAHRQRVQERQLPLGRHHHHPGAR